MQRLNRGMEHFWLAVVIASVIYATWQCFSVGWSEGYRNFFIPVVAFLWYLFRRFMRQRMEKNMNDK